ncbi:MAG: hypothetical protein E6R13_05840 [Spirochaetes bacterium]|nr:MAG: hypothetical protein E6R13_05840 [Spirochaetota bacterium]
MKNLFLIYVNMVGKDYKGNLIYEFIFSDTTKNIDGEEWDTFPASGRPEPPHENFIKNVGRLESELHLDVIQNSDTFAVWDAIDGVIALAWENINAYDAYPEKRLCFKFGETLEEVESKLYEKDLILNYSIKNYDKQK